MLDSRNIDIPFNPIFLAKILDPTYATDITTMMVRRYSFCKALYEIFCPLTNLIYIVLFMLLLLHRKLMLPSPIRYYSCSPL